MRLFDKLFKKKTSVDDIASATTHQPESPIPEVPTIIEKESDNGEKATQIIIPALQNGFPRYVNIIGTDITYDTESIEGISIIEEKSGQAVNIPGYEYGIEYYLQRKATELKRQKKLDIAIACLQKSNTIMSMQTDYYTKKEFLRLPEFLKKAGRFDDAQEEEIRIENLFSGKGYISICEDRISDLSQSSSRTELVEVPRAHRICETCAKYHDRLYALDEQNTRLIPYKKFSDYVNKKSCDCQLPSFPFWEGISIMNGAGQDDPIGYSNRPFEDDRTPKEKNDYDIYIQKLKTEKKNRDDYDWLRQYLPEIAPKSFGGYMRMKNSASSGYSKLVKAASDLGHALD